MVLSAFGQHSSAPLESKKGDSNLKEGMRNRKTPVGGFRKRGSKVEIRAQLQERK